MGLFVIKYTIIINPEGHPNHITGSKVTVILLNGRILPIGGVESGRVCVQHAKQAYAFNTLHMKSPTETWNL